MLLVKLVVMEFSVLRGEGGCGRRISMTVWRKVTIFFVVINIAANLASVVDDMTNLIILVIVRVGQFCLGIGSSSERKMWVPAWLRSQVSLRYPGDHVACTVGDAIVRVRGKVVKELVNSFSNFLSGNSLLGVNGAESDKKFDVNHMPIPH